MEGLPAAISMAIQGKTTATPNDAKRHMRKLTTAITERGDNGGMHCTTAYRSVTAMLDGHRYARPRLYHLVLLDDVQSRDASRFLTALKALCRKMRGAGIATRWRACLERDGDKGLHFHVFVLVDATVANPCKYINSTPTEYLSSMLRRRAMKFHLSQPKAPMHRVGGVATGKRKNYASLAGDKMADCLEWVSYLVKARSKPDDVRGIYFSSRDSLQRKATPPCTESLPEYQSPDVTTHA